MAHCCDTYTNFEGVQLRILANQVIQFSIESPLTLKKILAMRRPIMNLIYDLKEQSQKLFRENIPLNGKKSS
jgi:hypothetical protein